jgi:hypothetical protein
VVGVAGKTGDRRGHDLGEAGPDVDDLELGDDAVLGRGDRELAVDRLGRSERAQQRRHLRAVEPAGGVLADGAGELRMMGHARSRRPQGDRLVVRDPVADVEQVLGRALAAGLAQQLGHGGIAAVRVYARE